MADGSRQLTASIEALFEGVDRLVTTKTVVGDAVRVDGAVILPLMDVSCGMAAGSYDANAKNRGAGGVSAKMSPSAILIIQNGSTRLVNIKNQNSVNKVLDMVPDLVNRFTNGKVSIGEPVSREAVKAAEKMAAADGADRTDQEGGGQV